MTSYIVSNVAPFTPESLARRMIEQYGDEADMQAAMNADYYYEQNQNHIAKIWHETTKIIRAVQLLGKAAGVQFE